MPPSPAAATTSPACERAEAEPVPGRTAGQRWKSPTGRCGADAGPGHRSQADGKWWPARSVARPRPCASGCIGASATAAHGQARRRLSNRGSRSSNARCATRARPPRSCSWPVRLSPRRNPTASTRWLVPMASADPSMRVPSSPLPVNSRVGHLKNVGHRALGVMLAWPGDPCLGNPGAAAAPTGILLAARPRVDPVAWSGSKVANFFTKPGLWPAIAALGQP